MKMIKKIILILCISFAIPLLAMLTHLAIYEYHNTSSIYKESMIRQIDRTATVVSDYINTAKSRIERQAKNDTVITFINNIYDQELRAQTGEELEKMNEYSGFAAGTAVTDREGRVLSEYDASDFQYTMNYDILRNVIKTKKTEVYCNFIEKNDRVVFTVYSPVIFNGESIGALIQMVDADYFTNLINVNDQNSMEDMFLVDSGGHILGNKDAGYLTTMSFFNNKDGLNSIFNKTYEWKPNQIHEFDYTDKNGARIHTILKKISNGDICVLYSQNQSVVLTSVHHIIYIIGLYVLILIGVFIYAYIYIQSQLKEPFHEIIKTAALYEKGDFSYRPVITGDDEFNGIANSLWKMSERISKMYKEAIFNEYRYKLALGFASDLITDYNILENKYVVDREKWCKIFDFDVCDNEKQINEQITARVHPDDIAAFKSYREQLFCDIYEEKEKQVQLEFRMKLKDNEYHWILRRDILIKGQNGTIEHILGDYAVIDDKKRDELELTEKASFDLLSKLYNRATFIAKTKDWIKNNPKPQYAMMFLDVDNFKHINDTFGHKAGDDVIRYIASTIRDIVGGMGMGGRYGGDEFVAFIYQKEHAEAIAQTIMEYVPRNFVIHNTDDIFISIHVSIGIAYASELNHDVEDLLKLADDAMYMSKNSGKNRYTILDD